MSIIARLNGVPLFSSYKEAEVYGKSHGLKGFHTHAFQGQKGFMAGMNHGQATSIVNGEAVSRNIAPVDMLPPSDFREVNIVGGRSVANIRPNFGSVSGSGSGGGY